MVDIVTYRIRIGINSQIMKIRSSKSCEQGFISKKKNRSFKLLNMILLVIVLDSITSLCKQHTTNLDKPADTNVCRGGSKYVFRSGFNMKEYTPLNSNLIGKLLLLRDISEEYLPVKKGPNCMNGGSSNFWARYVHGNKKCERGIKNCHLNIRSILNKISEVRFIIKQQSPHIIGFSECELRKPLDELKHFEKKLKIPGYDTLFPKSWSVNGHARIIVYIKSSICYEQLHNLEDVNIQSIWIKGGFRNGRKLYFGHVYREHTSTMGNSLASQRKYLESLLQQWESVFINSSGLSTEHELHIMGDMNIDALPEKWLNSSYALESLARMVDSTCNYLNLSQLVKQPTRHQFNSIKKTTSSSCIDHIYTNAKYRCSNVEISSFGSSDHDLIGYTRYSKDPPEPSRTIRKRTYKNFNTDLFIKDLRKVDWRDILACGDIEHAVELFTQKLKFILDIHAPWVVYQQRKHFNPWLTATTIELMKERDWAKKDAINQRCQLGLL